jgi:hypothetical protein
MASYRQDKTGTLKISYRSAASEEAKTSAE